MPRRRIKPRKRVADVGAADGHLRQHAEFTMLLTVAAEHDVVAVGGQSRYEMAADEPSAAENELLCGHGSILREANSV